MFGRGGAATVVDEGDEILGNEQWEGRVPLLQPPPPSSCLVAVAAARVITDGEGTLSSEREEEENMGGKVGN